MYTVSTSEVMKFNRSLSLLLMGMSAISFAQQNSKADQVYQDLKTSTYFAQPSFNGKIDYGQINSLASQVKPYEFRLLAVDKLGPNWVKSGQEQRTAFAKYVADSKLGLGDKTILVVLTKSGISGYNRKLTVNELEYLDGNAKKLVTMNDFTPAIKDLATRVKAVAETKVMNRGTSGYSNKSASSSSSPFSGVGLFFCIGIPVAMVAAVVAIMFGAKKQKINRAKKAAEETKVKALNAMTYLDSYDGLLKSGQDADAVRQYRDRMGQTFDEGTARVRNGKTVADFDIANSTFNQVLDDFNNAKPHVSAITGDSGVAFTIPPIIDNQRAPLFEPMQGVSYFSSQPSDQLIPVEVNFGGTRKTVMVTPQERDQLMQGQMPQLRGQYSQSGQFMPWYAVSGYDPYRDYNSHNFIWDVIAISAISSMFTPHYGYGWGGGLFGGGYGGYGYGGGDTIINNYYEQNPGQNTFSNDSSGDFNFNGGSSGNDSSGDFDFGGSSGNDSGGFDTGGGGDSGGFDFGGGGDSGGSFDSGGGGDF